MWALPCVFGKDCEVVADSVELLAVALLLPLFCWTFSVTSLLAPFCWTFSGTPLLAPFCWTFSGTPLLAPFCWTFPVALVASWGLVCPVFLNTTCELLVGLEALTLSVVAAFTEWFVKLIPKMVTPNNTEATPTLNLRKL